MGFFFKKKKPHLFETEEWKKGVQEIKKYEDWQRRSKPTSDKYFQDMHKIEELWSELCNSKKFTGTAAKEFENLCINNISSFKNYKKFEIEQFGNFPTNAPAFKRLAMLYEKQGDYEKSIAICVDALSTQVNIIDAKKRMSRMLKKAGRNPTSLESKLLK